MFATSLDLRLNLQSPPRGDNMCKYCYGTISIILFILIILCTLLLQSCMSLTYQGVKYRSLGQDTILIIRADQTGVREVEYRTSADPLADALVKLAIEGAVALP